jgi:hypothetical protein
MSARRFALALLCAALLCAALPAQGRSLDATLALAGDNRAALEQALREVPAAERAGLEFLLAHMPEQDARKLSAEFLVRNVQLAYAARAKAPWNKGVGNDLADELFLHFVLPYAQANESREDWRSDFAARFAPTVAECQTPGEAAHRLNQTIFNALDVHYSTGRARADQAPSESIAQHKASCTGLSILLADACRAVGVPARLISVRWPHKAGNHTWVEVWDGAAWRFCGADEPDPQGLDRAWFVGDAAQCQGQGAQHAIWAVSFAATGTRFQAGWAPRVELHGIDVTTRYAKTDGPGHRAVSRRRAARAVRSLLRGRRRAAGASSSSTATSTPSCTPRQATPACARWPGRRGQGARRTRRCARTTPRTACAPATRRARMYTPSRWARSRPAVGRW